MSDSLTSSPPLSPTALKRNNSLSQRTSSLINLTSSANAISKPTTTSPSLSPSMSPLSSIATLDIDAILGKIDLDKLVRFDHLTSVLTTLVSIISTQNSEIVKLKQSHSTMANSLKDQQTESLKKQQNLIDTVSAINEQVTVLDDKLNSKVESNGDKIKNLETNIEKYFETQLVKMKSIEENVNLQIKTALETKKPEEERKNESITKSYLDSYLKEITHGTSSEDLNKFKTNIYLEFEKFLTKNEAEVNKEIINKKIQNLQSNNTSMHESIEKLIASQSENSQVMNAEEKLNKERVENLERTISKGLEKVAIDISTKLSLTNEAVIGLTSNFSEINEKLITKASVDDIELMKQKLSQSATAVDMEGMKKTMSLKILSMSETLERMSKTVQNNANEIDQQDRKLQTKASKLDLAQINGKIFETATTKSEMVASLKPIIQKIDQIIGKMVDIEKEVDLRAPSSLCNENKHRIDWLYSSNSIENSQESKAIKSLSSQKLVEGVEEKGNSNTNTSSDIANKNAEIDYLLKQEKKMLNQMTSFENKFEGIYNDLSEIRLLVEGKSSSFDAKDENLVTRYPTETYKLKSTNDESPRVKNAVLKSLSSVQKKNWPVEENKRWLVDTRSNIGGNKPASVSIPDNMKLSSPQNNSEAELPSITNLK